MANKRLVGTYVPSQLTIVISHTATGQSFALGGYGSDTIVSIERPTNAWESTIGADGYHERVHSLDKTIRATVTLLQTSEFNDFMNAVALYDEQDLRGNGLFTCTIADKSGRSAAYSDQAYVVQPSTYEFGTTSSTRDWMIVLPYADQTIGGNVKFTTELADKLAALGVNIDNSWIVN